MEAAVHFAKMGHDVTIVEMADKLMPEPPFIMNDTMLREMISINGVSVMLGSKVTAIDGHGVRAVSGEDETEIICDTVLLAMGWLPDSNVAERFEKICPVITIGDSNKCRNILSATGEAYEAVKTISTT